MPKSFKIITLGCKVNQYESAYVSEALSEAGWHRTTGCEKADVSIVNTCIVTQTASRQSRQEIRKAIRENPDGIVAATGCYAQAFSDELSEIEGLRLIAGNTEKGDLPEILRNFKESGQLKIACKAFEREAPFDFLPIKRFSNRSRAFLKIQDGCESFCSYCIVPVARGPLRSLSPTQVLTSLQSLAREGYREIVLTGIHLGKYGAGLEKGMDLNRLMMAIGKEGLPIRIRLSSLEINEIDSKLIEMMASEDWLCRHFHIPLQSGDDRILKRMKRHYTAGDFSRLVERIHKRIPLAAIGVDVMSGFPGEDFAAHQNICALIDDLPVSYVHAFPFSARPGTLASTMSGQVNPGITKKRAAEIRDLGQKKRSAFYQRCVGEEFMVLPEGWHSEKEGIMKGKTDNYLQVLFPLSENSNRPVPVLMESVKDNMLMGVT
jgi:threonylcarbamoyladenosine tRNA methylthiotransferase MtaB